MLVVRSIIGLDHPQEAFNIYCVIFAILYLRNSSVSRFLEKHFAKQTNILNIYVILLIRPNYIGNNKQPVNWMFWKMSHFTKITTKLYDRAIIEKSLDDLNIKYDNAATTIRGYKNQEHEAEIVVRQSNNHDIGFKYNGKEYELVADLMFWDQDYSVNKFINQVKQRYAFNLITKVSEEQSFQYVGAEDQNDGSIRLLLRKFS